jgi:hypothetical protein
MLDNATMEPLAPTEHPAEAQAATPTAPPDAPPTEPDATPTPDPAAAAPPAPAPDATAAATSPAPPLHPATAVDPASACLTDPPPGADPNAAPPLPPEEAPRLPEGFLSVLATMYQDACGSLEPLPAPPLPPPPDSSTAPGTAPATIAPGAAALPAPTVDHRRSARQHDERCGRTRPSFRLRRRLPPRRASAHRGKTDTRTQRKIPFRRRCYAACAGPP